MSGREAVGFSEEEVVELEMILTDEDAGAALDFLKRVVWKRIEQARRGRLKSHLDLGSIDPVQSFQEDRSEGS